jgi:hypothetical protein
MRSLRSPLVLLAGISLILGGCLGEESPKSSSQPAEQDITQVTVEGWVKHIDDQTPVDGGIEIRLRLDDGEDVLLLFGSLFTYPPPDDEKLQLYEVVRQVVVEDRVRAVGTDTARGIRIEQLTILK